MAKSIADTLKAGHKKAMIAIEAHLTKIGLEYAKKALLAAVKDWDETAKGRYNLTGNTRNGFVAAVYWNGRLSKSGGAIKEPNNPITVQDLDSWNVREVTSSIVTSGMGGFKDYSTQEDVSSVSQYNKESGLAFQNKGIGLFSKDLSLNFVNSPRVKLPSGMAVIVANMTPYGPYLVSMRNLDILTTQSDSSAVSSAMRESVSKLANFLESKIRL